MDEGLHLLVSYAEYMGLPSTCVDSVKRTLVCSRYGFRQLISASDAFCENGEWVSEVSAECTVLVHLRDGGPVSEASLFNPELPTRRRTEKYVESANQQLALSILMWRRDERRLALRCAVLAMPANMRWTERIFNSGAAMQFAEARTLSQNLQPRIGGDLEDYVARPDSCPTKMPRCYDDFGKNAGNLDQAMFAALGETLTAYGVVFEEPKSIGVEFAFPGVEPPTAVIVASSGEHPWYGAGAFISLSVSLFPEEFPVWSLNDWNVAASGLGGSHGLGGWVRDSLGAAGYRMFVPAEHCSVSILRDLLLSVLEKARRTHVWLGLPTDRTEAQNWLRQVFLRESAYKRGKPH